MSARQWIDPNAPAWICEKCGAVVNVNFGGFNSCGCRAGVIVWPSEPFTPELEGENT